MQIYVLSSIINQGTKTFQIVTNPLEFFFCWPNIHEKIANAILNGIKEEEGDNEETLFEMDKPPL